MPNNYYNVTTTFIPGTKARSDQVNTEYQGVESAFDKLPTSTTALTKGTATFAGSTGGTGNAYTVTMPDTRTSNINGDQVVFIADRTNTGAATLDVDGLGATAIVRADGTALVANDLEIGLIYSVRFDNANSRWQLLSPSTSYLTDASASAAASAASAAASATSAGNAATSESNAATSETNAAGSASLAQEWAVNAIDVAITGFPGQYSALHWADGAGQAWATQAEDSPIQTSFGGDGATTFSALHWAAKASAASGLPNSTIANSSLRGDGASGWVESTQLQIGSGNTLTWTRVGAATNASIAIDADAGVDTRLQYLEAGVQKYLAFWDSSAGIAKHRLSDAGDSLRIEEGNGTNIAAQFTPNAGQALYFSGDQRFVTTNSGADIQADALAAGILTLTAGTAQSSFMRTITDGGGAALTTLSGGNGEIRQTDTIGNDEGAYIGWVRNGATSLYHNDSLRLSTTAVGATITDGTDSFIFTAGVGANLEIVRNGAFRIAHNTSVAANDWDLIWNNSSTTNDGIKIQNDGQDVAHFDSTVVELYHGSSGSLVFQTESYGASITGVNTTTQGGRLQLNGAPTYNDSYWYQSGNNLLAYIDTVQYMLASTNSVTFNAGTSASLALNTSQLLVSDVSLLSVRDAASTASISMQMYTSEGGIEFRSDGGTVNVYQATSVGGITDNWMRFNLDDSVDLFFNNANVFRTQVDGVQLRGDGTDVVLSFRNNTGTQLGYLRNFEAAAGNMELVNANNSGSVHIRADNSVGTSLLLGAFDPDGDTEIYHGGANELRIQTQSNGVDILTPDGSNVVDIVATGAAVTANLGLRTQSNGFRARILEADGSVQFRQTAADGSTLEDTWMQFNRDGAVNFYHNSTLKFSTSSSGLDANGNFSITVDDNDFIVRDTTDAVTNFIFRDHSVSTLYLGTADAVTTLRSDLRLNGNAITHSSATNENILTATANAETSLYHNNLERLITESTGVRIRNETSSDPILSFGEGTTERAAILYDVSTNQLKVRTREANSDLLLQVRNVADTAYDIAFQAISDGAVSLYYDGTALARTKAQNTTTDAFGAFEIDRGDGNGFAGVALAREAFSFFGVLDTDVTYNNTISLSYPTEFVWTITPEPGSGVEVVIMIEAVIFVSAASATPDLRLRVDHTGNAAGPVTRIGTGEVIQGLGTGAVASTTSSTFRCDPDVTETGIPISVQTTGSVDKVRINAILSLTNNSPYGDLRIGFAQSTANASNTIIKRGSWVRYRAVRQ